MSTFFLMPAMTFAQQYYVQYPANAFVPVYDGYTFAKGTWWCNLSHYTPTSIETGYVCPVNFYLTSLYIKSMSVDYRDNSSTGKIHVRLMRMHFPSRAVSIVAEFQSSESGTPGFAKGHVSTNAGTKYIDTTYWTYWLEIFFSEGSTDLSVYSIRIQYGT